MAIDPKLVSIIPASDLPTGDPTSAGQFFFYEGDVMKKAPMTNIYDKVTSGIKGNATQSNAPITYSAETHPDGLIETYRAVEPLNNASAWYTLADATNKAKFPITQDMLNANDVLMTATNGVVTVFLNAKPVADPAKLNTWTATTFTSGAQVISDGRVYEANAATLSTDVPGVSSKWVEKISGKDEQVRLAMDSLLGNEVISNTTTVNFSTATTGILKRDNTIVADATNKNILNVSTGGANKMTVKMIRMNIANSSFLYASILGIKAGGEKDTLIDVPHNATNTVEEFTINNISQYTSLSFSYNGTYTPEVKLITSSGEALKPNAVEENIKIGGKFKTINSTTGAVMLDLNTDRNVIFTTSVVDNYFGIKNIQQTDSFTLFHKVTTPNTTLNFNYVVWQDGEAPVLNLGYSYFLLFNTFDGGLTWYGSVISKWVNTTSTDIIGNDDFESAGEPVTDLLGNTYIKTSGDVFAKSGGKLGVTSKTSTNAKLYIATPWNRFAVEIRFDKADFNGFGMMSDMGTNGIYFCARIIESGGSYTLSANAAVGESLPTAFAVPVVLKDTDNVLRVEKINDGVTYKYYLNGGYIYSYTDSAFMPRKTAGVLFANTTARINSLKILKV